MDLDAKRTALFNLLKGYWQLAEKLDRSLLDSYVNAVDGLSVEAVALVCQRINGGEAGLNTSYPPTPADIAERARLLDAGNKPTPDLYNGLIEMDFGHGRVDMRGLDNAEQDFIIRNHGMIGGQNAALLSLEAKRAAIAGTAKIGSAGVVPKLRKM